MRVIVVDNGAEAELAALLQRWLAGDACELPAPSADDPLAPRWWPTRGVPTARWQRLSEAALPAAPATCAPWTYVRAAANRGFGAGMNVGLRVALADPDVHATWLLNNDTVVDAHAVAAIRARVAMDATVGQWGTEVRYHAAPHVRQSDGRLAWSPWFARGSRMGDGEHVDARAATAREVRAADTTARADRRLVWPEAVYGASWVLRHAAVREVGALSEAALLYGEELDWAARARGRWEGAVIPEAIVWHREGATAGGGQSGPKSAVADLWGIAARLRLTRRFFVWALPTVYFGLVGAAAWRLLVRRQPDRAKAIVRLLVQGDRALATTRTAPVPTLRSHDA